MSTDEKILIVEKVSTQYVIEPVARVFENDKPNDISWGDWVKISSSSGGIACCKLLSKGNFGLGKLYINPYLRGLLNVQPNLMYEFVFEKVSDSEANDYLLRNYPNSEIRKELQSKSDAKKDRKLRIVAIIVSVIGILVTIFTKLAGWW